MSSEVFDAQEDDIGGKRFYRSIHQLAEQIKKSRDGRCLLALDGGGLKALSMILILEEISNRIMHDLSLGKPPSLCDYLDLIAGVGIGGYFAILIGRLGLTVPELKEEYAKLEMGVLSQRAPSGLVDEAKLNRHLKDVIQKYTGNSDALMFDPDSPTNHCKVFVVSTPKANMLYIAKFRSYEANIGRSSNCTIWQAARATLVLPHVFPPIEIGQGIVKQVYVGGTMGVSNPSDEVVKEFESQWTHEKIGSLISIGAGHDGVIQLAGPSSSTELNSTLGRMATDSERVSQRLEDRFRGQHIYFRLSVEQGLQDINQKRINLEEINTHTRVYLESPRVTDLVNELVECLEGHLDAPDYANTRQHFTQTMDQYMEASRQIVAQIHSEHTRSFIQEAVAVMDLIKTVTAYEWQWIPLARLVYEQLKYIAQDFLPKVADLNTGNLWERVQDHFRNLRIVHDNVERKITLRSSRDWGFPTHVNLIFESMATLEKSFKELDDSFRRREGSLVIETHRHVVSLIDNTKFKELLKKVSEEDPDLRHLDVRAKRAKNTGSWLLQSQKFQDWEANREPSGCRALCGFGSPGAGKTTSCSSVIDHLNTAREERNAAVIYTYLSFDDQRIQTFDYMIRMMTKQLLIQARSAPEEVWRRSEKHNSTIVSEDVQAIFSIMLRQFGLIYLCIDALDECNDYTQRRLLTFVNTDAPPILRLFCTARYSVELEVVSTMPNLQPATISITADREDIRIYLEEKIMEDDRVMNESLKKEIIKKICSMCDGIFLLATLQCQFVLEPITIGDRRDALENLPIDLSEIYTTTIERIRMQSKSKSEMALKVLTWVYLAKQQLRADTLQLALAVRSEGPTVNMDYSPTEEAMLNCCHGLVVVESETRMIRLAHFTLHEYLAKQWEELCPNGHFIIASTCLAYLTCLEPHHHHSNSAYPWIMRPMSVRKNPLPASDNKEKCKYSNTKEDECERKGCWSLLQYTSNFVGNHLRNVQNTTLDHTLQEILNDDDKFHLLLEGSARWWEFYSGFCCEIGEINPLHWIAGENILSIVRSQLDLIGPFRINEEDLRYQRTALSYAAQRGHHKMVNLLLDIEGIEINARDRSGRTPLSYAAEHGHVRVVQRLLERSYVGIDLRDNLERTPFSFAITMGHKDVARLLLGTQQVDVNQVNSQDQMTALSYTAQNGHHEMIDLLLDIDDIELNARDWSGRTPLFYAVKRGDIRVVQRLLPKSCIQNEQRAPGSGLQAPVAFAY